MRNSELGNRSVFNSELRITHSELPPAVRGFNISGALRRKIRDRWTALEAIRNWETDRCSIPNYELRIPNCLPQSGDSTFPALCAARFTTVGLRWKQFGMRNA
jgi:hypothetical protein